MHRVLVLILVFPATPTFATGNEVPGPWLVHANLGVNVYTYLGAKGGAPAEHVTPNDRFILLQQLGAGYFVHPNLRLQLTLQFIEVVSGLPEGASHFTLFGFIPWAVLTDGRFFSGLGVLLAPRSYGTNDLDAGIFTAHGVGFPLGGGWSIAGALQIPITLKRRLSIALSPSAILLRRF